MPWIGLRCMIVVVPDHTDLNFWVKQPSAHFILKKIRKVKKKCLLDSLFTRWRAEGLHEIKLLKKYPKYKKNVFDRMRGCRKLCQRGSKFDNVFFFFFS